MGVLVLGLPRSGTDSLRTALRRLGYTTIWHGFELPATRQSESFTWVPLLEAKAAGDPDGLVRGFDWDTMLGDCDVLMVCNVFFLFSIMGPVRNPPDP